MGEVDALLCTHVSAPMCTKRLLEKLDPVCFFLLLFGEKNVHNIESESLHSCLCPYLCMWLSFVHQSLLSTARVTDVHVKCHFFLP